MIGADGARLAQDHGALEDVAQFADIAGPGVRTEQIADLCVYSANVAAVLGIQICENVLHQQRQIFFAFPQTGQMNVEDVQSKI